MQQATITPPPSDSHPWRRWTRYAVVGGVLAAAAVFGLYWRAGWPRRHFQRALQALDARRFDAVQAELSTLEAVATYKPHCHYLRGALLLAKRQIYPALEQFAFSVNDPELRTRTLALSGQALYQVQRFGEAAGLLSRAVEADPEAAETRRWLALAYYDLGWIDPAITQLAKIAELEPSDARPHQIGRAHV